MLALPPRQEGWIKESPLFHTQPASPPSFSPLNFRHDTSGKSSHLQNKGISEPFFHLKNRFPFPPWITPSFYPLIFLGLFFLSACSGGSSDSSSSNASNDNLEECSAGMLAGEEEKCRLPEPGHFVNSDGEEQACTKPIGLESEWLPTPEEGLAEDKCPFACSQSAVKKEGETPACNPPEGKYIDTEGEVRPCGEASGTLITDSASIGGQPQQVSNPNQCPFTCTAGTTKNTVSKTCDLPDSGVWYNSGTKTSCTAISHQSGWIPSPTQLTSDTCDFNCQTGYKKVGRACNPPTPGTYFQANGREAPCSPQKPQHSSWVTGPASTATECDFICTVGYVKDKGASTCSPPSGGQWADGGIAKPCTPIQHSVWTSSTGAVSSAATCPFSCKSGFDKSGRSCDLPSRHFIASDGTAQSCGVRPRSSTGWETVQSGVSQAQNCVFACAAGRDPVGTGSSGKCNVKEGYFLEYVDNLGKNIDPTSNSAATQCDQGYVSNGNRTHCVRPPKGYYSDASRIQKPCGKAPASSTDWKSVQSISVDQAQKCEFDCASGRTASGTGSSGSCALNDGHFPASTALNSAGTACVSPPAASTGWAADQSSVTRQDDCIFECGTDRRIQGTGSSGSCALIVSCSSGNTPNRDQTQCMPNQRACQVQVADGTGQETWDPTSDDYGSCSITGCDAGFHEKSDQCVGVDSNYVSSAGSTAQTQCQGSQKPNAQKSTCVNCDQAGFYVNGGVCLPVDTGYVSAANTQTQTKCTGTNIPNGDKNACINSGCPLHFIPVPKLAGYTTADFCVAKYEMKNDGSGNAVSKAASLPWADITRADAITKCQAMGSGYDLIINNEWQTLARNIELVNTNWNSGQVGSGKLNTGRTSAPLAASSDDLQACHGTGQTCDATTVWHTQRRTHILSNGLAVWDLGSSVGEWIKQNDKKAFPEVNFGENDIRVFTGDEKSAFGPQGSYTSNVGLGGNITAYGGDIYRGGVHSGLMF